MPRLTIADFNTARYYGYDGNMPGGYGLYQPVHYIINPMFNSDPENDEWSLRAQRFVDHGGLVGRTIIELGCGFGSLWFALCCTTDRRRLRVCGSKDD